MKRILFAFAFLMISCAGGSSAPSQDAGEDSYNNMPGDFGTNCSDSSNCSSGWCVEFADGNLKCTVECSMQDCPSGFSCRPVDKTSGTTLCLPIPGNICASCTTDNDCGDSSERCLMMNHIGGCLMDCSVGGYCPDNFICTQGTSESGFSGSFCVPKTGSCDCTEANAGVITTCTVDNEYGSCEGTKQCTGETGWTDCNAKTPAPEICDGEDNNCDGNIDEGLLGTSENCSACGDVCDGGGIEGTLSECVDGQCQISCENDYYNPDGEDYNGCECHDDSQGGESIATAKNLGNFDDHDFTFPVNDLRVPVDATKTAHADYFSYHYENTFTLFVYAYNYVRLQVPSSGSSMKICGGSGSSESSWNCETVSPGQSKDLEMLPLPDNGDSTMMYFKVENLTTQYLPSCGEYSLVVYDDGG